MWRERKRCFLAFRFQLGSFARSGGVLAGSLRNLLSLFTGRSLQRLTLKKNYSSLLCLPVAWGELCCEHAGCLEIFKDFFFPPVQGVLETTGNKTAAATGVFHLYFNSCCCSGQWQGGEGCAGGGCSQVGREDFSVSVKHQMLTHAVVPREIGKQAWCGALGGGVGSQGRSWHCQLPDGFC